MVALSSLAISPAYAGPDDGKPVATQTHIDGPKVFWENGNFVLRTEGKFDGMPKSAPLMDDVVNWVGQGYSAGGSAKSEPQFMYTVPNLGGEPLAFLGAPGDTWYQAPKVNVKNLDPIWIGMGADAGLPVDTFRDGTASIDLLSVDGPGQVEWVASSFWDGHWDVRRILSSSDPTRRSHKVTAGTHGHMDTLFSKPGRYTMTYQASARLHDGTLVQSEPQQQVWQVGGNRPAAEASQPFAEQYDQSAQGSPAIPYEVTYASAEGSVTDARMDGKLTDISFSAAPDVFGTLTLFVDGYFHSELPVAEGKATARELMGTATSTVQGVFIPANGGSADAPAYILAPAEYQHGNVVRLTSEEPAGALPVPVPTDSPSLAFEEHAPTSLGYAASIKPLGDDRYQADIQFDDADIRAFVLGGIYDSPDDAHATMPFSGETGATQMSDIFAWDAEYDGTLAKVIVVPHPTSTIKTFTIELPDALPATSPVVVRGLAEVDTTSVVPGPTPAPTPVAPTPSNPSQPNVCAQPDGRVQLVQGHVDLKAVHSSGKGLSMVLADETAQVDKHAVDRDPNTVTLLVTGAAKTARLPAHANPDYDFLGPVGAKVYRLPQTQKPGIIWPGWNTMDIDYSTLAGGVQLQLREIQAPEGGEVKVFTTNAFGKPSLLLDSAGSKKSIDISYATHTHADWIFTEAGIYDLTLAFAANSKDGSTLDSSEHTLRFVVDQLDSPPCETNDVVTPGAPTPTTSTEVVEDPPSGNGASGAPFAGEPRQASAHDPERSADNAAGGLAATGAESLAIVACSVLLMLAGGALVLHRRRTGRDLV